MQLFRSTTTQGGSGTGFLVSRKIDDDHEKVFLVTNKHVVSKDPILRPAVPYVVCHFNTKEPDGTESTLSGKLQLTMGDGIKRFREHPDPDTDVYAIEVTDVMLFYPKIEKRFAVYDHFADKSKRNELDITVGEDIVTIGYPLGLRQGNSNFPLVRQGMIATKIGVSLKDKVRDADGKLRDRTLRAFLIDSSTVPGSSGSPVILKPVIGRIQGDSIVTGPAPPVLLGIIAETKYAPVYMGTTVVQSFAGLGLVFEVETIRETIELFFL